MSCCLNDSLAFWVAPNTTTATHISVLVYLYTSVKLYMKCKVRLQKSSFSTMYFFSRILSHLIITQLDGHGFWHLWQKPMKLIFSISYLVTYVIFAAWKINDQSLVSHKCTMVGEQANVINSQVGLPGDKLSGDVLPLNIHFWIVLSLYLQSVCVWERETKRDMTFAEKFSIDPAKKILSCSKFISFAKRGFLICWPQRCDKYLRW